MGLAASQARFLAITARKMNCEFRSMQIAQEKLSITRDLQQASQNYQDSLDQTTLVWDVDGSEDGLGEVYNLSYDLLMNPTVFNNYEPNLITDKQGKIVLSNDMYNAAVAAGIIDKDTGRPLVNSLAYTEDGRNKFLQELGKQNIISASFISSIINLENGYAPDSGVGGLLKDKTLADALNGTNFIKYLQTAVDENDNILYNVGLLSEDGKAGVLAGYKITTDVNLAGQDAKSCVIFKDGTALTETQVKELTLGDLLKENYEIVTKLDGSPAMKGLCDSLVDNIANKLGADSTQNEIKGLNVDIESQDALKQAIKNTKLLYLNDKAKSSTSSSTINIPFFSSGKEVSSSSQSAYDLSKEARDTNHYIKGEKDQYTVSLTNMLKSYLTNFAICLEGFDCGFFVKDEPKNSSYVTSDSGYYFLTRSDGVDNRNAALNADFYNMLYNQLCMNGACSDETKRELVEDKSYLGNAIKNGQLFISSVHEDGYFYQKPYVMNEHVAEVQDEEAIARAEVEYEITKSKLNYREQTLDLQMKNLDTELSALTTEFDTVKNLISKNVEKIFTMFSS